METNKSKYTTESLASLIEMFPTLSTDVLAATIKKHQFDMTKAIEELCTMSSTDESKFQTRASDLPDAESLNSLQSEPKVLTYVRLEFIRYPLGISISSSSGRFVFVNQLALPLR
jgi:hypothetical protein